MKKLLLLVLVIVLCSFAYAIDETHDVTFDTTDTSSAQKGFIISVNETIIVSNINKSSLSTAVVVYFLNSSQDELARKNFTGHNVNLSNASFELTLQPGNDYYFLTNDDGAIYNDRNKAGVSFPIDSGYITWKIGFHLGLGNVTEAHNFEYFFFQTNQSEANASVTLDLINVTISPEFPLDPNDLQGFANASTSTNVNLSYDFIWYKNHVEFETSNANDSSFFCFQEQANESTECGGLDTGSYNASILSFLPQGSGGYTFINYSKPNNFNSVMWQVDIGHMGKINYSVPHNCSSNHNFTGKIQMLFMSDFVGATTWDSYGYCMSGDDPYDAGSWTQLFYNRTADGDGGSFTSPDRQYDGDYTTSAKVSSSPAYETENTNKVAELIEESMFWNLTLTPYNSSVNSLLNTIPEENTSIDDNWTFSVRAWYNNEVTAWQNFSVLIANYSFFQCEDGNHLLNITLKEEQNFSLIPGTILGNHNITIDGLTVAELFFEINDQNNVSFCTNTTAGQDVQVNSFITHEAEGGIIERWFIVNTTMNTNDTGIVDLHNFQDSTPVSELKISVLDENLDNFPNVIVKLQRFYPSLNAFVTVQMDKSDDFGEAVFYIIQNSVDYKFVFEKDNEVLKITDPIHFICQTGPCENSFTVPSESTIDSFKDLTIIDSYNNVTGIYTVTWSDTSNLISSIRVLGQVYTGVAIIDVCDTRVSSSSGTINCNVSGINGEITIRTFASASPDSPQLSFSITNVLDKLWQQASNNFDVERSGLLLSAIIMMGAIGFGAFSPLATIFMSVVGLIVIFLLGMANFLNITLIITGAALGAIVLYIIRR